ncbi:hypothetical protein [Microvirga subterranea]|uniref:YpeB-like protein with protease inhibitory function n=1 Tax=Microvirga subterranea TaxID=186651 RepID=A0A370HNH5_9HYPH|nr:hypothetical protein [Microvirga subterranea]RDI60088.1 hypothetical protein DES45_103349 [Microvirga subterranea]
MTRMAILTAVLALAAASLAQAREPQKPRPELTCSANDTPEQEAEKEIRYVVDGKEHIEYCVMGKKHVIIDSGDNG